MKQLIVLILSVIMLKANAQEGHTKLKSQGKLPNDFIELSSSKYHRDKINIKDQDRYIRKAKDNFYLTSNYEIRDLLYSGIVLFNDPISNYCKQTFKNLLINNQDKYHDIRIYVLKSSEVNAFATDQGIIFVTLGLIERLNTEAQLAFILGHELAHYVRKDNISSTVEKTKIEKNKDNYKGLNYDNKILAKHAHSREAEKAADLWGIELVTKSDYNTGAALSSMEVLKYSYLPYSNNEVDLNSLIPGYINSDKLQIFSPVNPIDEREEDFPDEKSSHPNIAKRKKYLKEIDNNNGKDFIQPEASFNSVKRIAREELAELHLKRHRYDRAIYQALINIDHNYDENYNSAIIGKALYLASKAKESEHFEDLLPEEEEIEGNIHTVYQLLAKLNEVDLKLLALSYNYNLKAKNPQNKEFGLMVNDLAKVLTDKFGDSISFSNISSIMDNSIADQSFIAIINNGIFEKDPSSDQPKTEKTDNALLSGLGIDNMVFVNPVHLRYSYNVKNLKTLHEEAETSEIELNSFIKNFSDDLNLNHTILDDKTMKLNDIDLYNDYCALQGWVSFFAINHSLGINTVNIFYNETAKLTGNYNTPYFCWTGYLTLRNIDPMFPIQAGATLSTIPLAYLILGLPPVIPGVMAGTFFFVKAISRKSEMFFYYTIFDMENGTLIFNQNLYIPKKDKIAYVKANLYEYIQLTHSNPNIK